MAVEWTRRGRAAINWFIPRSAGKTGVLAPAPNQLWNWEITKLLGPAKWTYFYLHFIFEIYSRYVAGWIIAHRESCAKQLCADTCDKQHIKRNELTIHAGRGSSMTS